MRKEGYVDYHIERKQRVKAVIKKMEDTRKALENMEDWEKEMFNGG
jgi:hypothetical protein